MQLQDVYAMIAAIATRITLVVSLTIQPGREAEFDQFETAAVTIMKRYGGAIERRIRCAPPSGSNAPYEVHIVTFPDAESHASYRSDPELKRLADLRDRAVSATTVWYGIDLSPKNE